MEARGVHLRGLGFVVQHDEGPRLVFRYDKTPDSADGTIFTSMADADFAKLFCAKKSLRDGLVELQLEDALFVSCPTSEVPAADAGDVFWGDDDEAVADECVPERRLKFFDVVWAVTGAAPGARDDAGAAAVSLESLAAAVRDVAAALRHEERRCGYVSAQCALMLAAAPDRTGADAFAAMVDASSLARELRDAFDGAAADRRVRARFNRWVAVCGRLARPRDGSSDESDDPRGRSDGSASSDGGDGGDASPERGRSGDRFGADPAQATRRARRRRRRRRSYAPYEALLLFDDAKTVLADLPKSVTPQLRQLLAAAAPTASFHALAASTGLPLSRVYRLARHLVEWKKARVVTVVRSDSVYAVDDRAPAVPDGGDELRRRRALAVLAAFGPARRLGDALDDLERQRVPDATKTVLRLLTSGHLRELHTYVLRIDGAPPPGLEAAANAAVAPGAGFRLSLDDRDDDSLHGRQPRPAAGDAGAPHHLRLLHIFRALSPYFDGHHALVEMMWRENLKHGEIHAALTAFSDLVVTVQR